MSLSPVFTIFLLKALYMYAISQEAKIVIPPGPVNTSVNGVANFTCTAIANAFRWEANGVQIDSNERIAINMAPVNAEQRRSTLDMTISSTDNATNITCTAISLNRQNESTAGRSVTSDVSVPVLLLVQGILEPVSNLTVTHINSTTVFISWSPPLTLVGVPILGYNVTIINTANEKSEQFCTDDQTLGYQPAPGTTYIINVVPINQAGPGQIASLSEDFPFLSITYTIPFTSSMVREISSTVDTGSLTVTAQQETSSTQIFSSPTPIHSNNPPSDPTLDTPKLIGIIIGVLVVVAIISVVAAVALSCFKKQQGQEARCFSFEVQRETPVEPAETGHCAHQREAEVTTSTGDDRVVETSSTELVKVDAEPKPIPKNPNNGHSQSQLSSPSYSHEDSIDTTCSSKVGVEDMKIRKESTSECVSVPRSVGIDKPKHKHVRKVESGDVMIFSTPHAPAPPPWPFPSLFMTEYEHKSLRQIQLSSNHETQVEWSQSPGLMP